MSVLIAIPVFRIGCRVGIDRGRTWSVIDEAILWALTRQSQTIANLSSQAALPKQLVIASIARLMRFRLVEVVLAASSAAFRASEYGRKAVSSGDPLPFFPKRISRRASFVIDWATGDFFPTRQVRLLSRYKLDLERQAGTEVRVVVVRDGGPSMTHEANLDRLSEITARGWDEQVAFVDPHTATMRDDEYLIVRLVDGEAHGLPETASIELRRVVAEAAASPPGSPGLSITYRGKPETISSVPVAHACNFDTKDLVIGGPEHRTMLVDLLGQAHRRVIVHSTFLDAKRFESLLDPIRAACARGVKFDLLWGAEKDDDTETRNGVAAAEIARIAQGDKDLHDHVRVHMRTTGSHSKFILIDTAEDGWIGGVGSCNWLSAPFNSVELSVVLRDQHLVSDLMVVIQRLTGRRGLADRIASEMGITANDLRRLGAGSGDARMSVIIGEGHDRLMRQASGAAESQFVVGSNRLGSTARPGVLIQGGVAAARPGMKATVLYTQPSGPLKNRHARGLAEEARRNGFALVKTRKTPLHGKFLVWDADDLVVTSLNWASASADPDFPWGEIGIHVHAAGVGSEALERLKAILPEISQDPLAEVELTAPR